jgi:hypothetical protein
VVGRPGQQARVHDHEEPVGDQQCARNLAYGLAVREHLLRGVRPLVAEEHGLVGPVSATAEAVILAGASTLHQERSSATSIRIGTTSTPRTSPIS